MTVYTVISLPKIPYICTIYDHIYSDFPAQNTVLHRIYMVLANPTDTHTYTTKRVVISLLKIPYTHRVGHNYYIYTVCIRYFGRDITKYTVIYSV
jgi:hypothetical protein